MRQLAIVKMEVKEPQMSDWEEKKTVLERKRGCSEDMNCNIIYPEPPEDAQILGDY